MPQLTHKSGSLTSHVSWLMLAKTVSFVLGTALPLVLVRRLTQANFGLYKQLFLVAQTATNILPLSFGMSAYYFLPREKERQAETVFHIVLFNLVIGTLACLCLWQWPQLLGIIFHQTGLADYAPAIGVLILLWIFSYFLEIVPIANREIKWATGAIIVVQFSRTALFLGAALMWGTIWALVWAGLAQGLLQCAVLLWYLRSRFGAFWRHFDAAMLRGQLSYALPLGFAGLLWVMQTDLHNYFVASRFGPAVFALYAVGTVQIPLINMLQEATNSVLIPHICLLQQQDDKREIIGLTARAMRKLAAVYFPVCVFLLLFAREFIAFLFTRRYVDSAPVFMINLLLLPFMTVLQDPLFRAYASQRYFLVRLRILMFCLLAAGLWFGTARFGMLGAITVVVSVNALERIITAIRFGGVLDVRRGDIVLLKDVGKLAVAAVIAGLAAAALRSSLPFVKPLPVLAACGVGFCLVYGAVLLAAGVLSGPEKEMIRRKVSVVLRQAMGGA
jgi:O-antigen/teichoic acid export membrane protein